MSNDNNVYSNEEVQEKFNRADEIDGADVDIINKTRHNGITAIRIPNKGVAGHPPDYKVISKSGKVIYYVDGKEDIYASRSGRLCIERKAMIDTLEWFRNNGEKGALDVFIKESFVIDGVPRNMLISLTALADVLKNKTELIQRDGMTFDQVGTKTMKYKEIIKNQDVTNAEEVLNNLLDFGNPGWCIPISLLETSPLFKAAIIPMENIFGSECTEQMIKSYGIIRVKLDAAEAAEKKEVALRKELEAIEFAKGKKDRYKNTNWSAFAGE